MELSDVVATVYGEPISVADVLIHVKVNGSFLDAVYQLISDEVVAQAVADMGLKVSDTEVQSFARAKRRELGLRDAIAMNKYCNRLGISLDQWQRETENECLRGKLMQAMFKEREIRQVYKQNKHEFVTYNLSRIVCANEFEIAALQQRIVDAELDFAVAARGYSIEENTRIMNGYVGSVMWGMLPADVREHFVDVGTGKLVGPFQQDGFWVLYRVDELSGNEYNGEVRQQLTERLFYDWLESSIEKAPR